MKKFIDHFIWMFGGICFIAVIIEIAFSIFQGTEFGISKSTFIFYMIFSLFFASYRTFSGKTAAADKPV